MTLVKTSLGSLWRLFCDSEKCHDWFNDTLAMSPDPLLALTVTSYFSASVSPTVK